MLILDMKILIGRQVNKMEKLLYECIGVTLPDGFRTMTEEEVQAYYNNTTLDAAFIESEKRLF